MQQYHITYYIFFNFDLLNEAEIENKKKANIKQESGGQKRR